MYWVDFFLIHTKEKLTITLELELKSTQVNLSFGQMIGTYLSNFIYLFNQNP